jgi:hypothetical protein
MGIAQKSSKYCRLKPWRHFPSSGAKPLAASDRISSKTRQTQYSCGFAGGLSWRQSWRQVGGILTPSRHTLKGGGNWQDPGARRAHMWIIWTCRGWHA